MTKKFAQTLTETKQSLQDKVRLTENQILKLDPLLDNTDGISSFQNYVNGEVRSIRLNEDSTKWDVAVIKNQQKYCVLNEQSQLLSPVDTDLAIKFLCGKISFKQLLTVE